MQVSLTENIAMSKCCMDTNSVAKCACRLAIINLDYLQARRILFEFGWVDTFTNSIQQMQYKMFLLTLQVLGNY